MVFFMLYHVGFMLVMLGALKFIAWKTAEHHEFRCILGHGAWRGLSKIRCFMSGWGFVSGLQVPILQVGLMSVHACHDGHISGPQKFVQALSDTHHVFLTTHTLVSHSPGNADSCAATRFQ